MLKIFSLIIITLFFVACNGGKSDGNLQQELKKDSTAKSITINIASPQIIDSSHIIIYPLVFEKTSYGGYGSSSGGERTVTGI